MSIGSTVRRLLGPIEAPVGSTYRAFFLDVDALGKAIDSIPFGPRVLEVGVGDGLVAAQIVFHRPEATVLSIDLSSNLGRFYQGDRNRVTFRTVSTSNLLAESPDPFDAIVISDVLHHVPASARTDLLGDVNSLLAEDGVLLVKESVISKSLGFWLGNFSDRWISGDRSVSFMTEADLGTLVTENVDGLIPCGRATIRPWRMNLLLGWRRERV